MSTIFFSAIFASILHVISGPDHLAAVTPLAISTKKDSWKTGTGWGLGHLIGMLIVGVLFLIFRELIPLEQISGFSEQIVALVLIGIGFWSLYKIYSTQKHKKIIDEAHSKNDINLSKQQLFSSFSIGFIHGLAGIAHFILLLPVLALDSHFDGLLYIGGFAIGTVLAMTLYSMVIGYVSLYSNKMKRPIVYKSIQLLGAFFAIGIGIYWGYLTL